MGTIEKRKIVYLDVLRAIACLAVVMIHVSGNYCYAEPGSLRFWIGNMCDGLSQFGVPLFVMISGALMLDKNYVFTKEKWFGHIKKLVLFFVFWSSIYCLWFRVIENLSNGEPLSIEEILSTFFGGYYHLWFIPMMIGLYLILPLLRIWVNEENRKQVEYFLLLSFVFCSLLPQCFELLSFAHPYFQIIESAVNSLQLRYVAGYAAYFVLGWYLNTKDSLPVRKIIIAGVGGMVFTVAGTYVFTVLKGEFYSMYGNTSVNIWLYVTALFVFVKVLCRNKEQNGRIVTMLCKYSMGIYAVHVALNRQLAGVLGNNSAAGTLVVTYLVVLVLSIVISAVMKKIPFLRKMV